jgi:hypothetical protein
MRLTTRRKPETIKMNRKQLRNAKIDLVSTLQAKMRRFAAGLSTPGVDRAAIEAILEKTRCQIDDLEREIAILG